MKKILLVLAFLSTALFADAIGGAVQKQSVNMNAIIMFGIFVVATLGVTYWAASKTKTAKDFYAAGGGISGKQNGLAIAGDFMSAASFLGISGLVYTSGFDGLIYSIGFLVGWPIILFLIAEPLRNLGKYTFADVASFRLRQTDIRTIAAAGTIVTVLLYLIAQMVGAGKLIQLLFGLDYYVAVIIVGVLMILYVTFGGMLATTWIQIIKACLLLAGASFIAFMVMSYFSFSPEKMFESATTIHTKHLAIMEPGGLVSDPWNAISLGLALMFGTAGLPHILMRFFTVADAKEARKSVFYATGLIGYFYILTFIIGFGAVTLLALHPEYFTKGVPAFIALVDGNYTVSMEQNISGATQVFQTMVASDTNQSLVAGTKFLHGGDNMTAIHLSQAVGGDMFLGFISAVAFATILAVVSGLTLSGASAISHDLYANVIAKGRTNEVTEMKASRIATLTLGVLAIILGIAFEKQNVAYMVGLAFAIAASVNFPILILSIYWKGLTTKGAFVGGFVGLFSAIILVIMGPAVWKDVMGNKEALISLKNPAIVSMTLTFIVTYLVSKMDSSARAQEDIAGFESQFIRAQTGIGAEGASEH